MGVLAVQLVVRDRAVPFVVFCCTGDLTLCLRAVGRSSPEWRIFSQVGVGCGHRTQYPKYSSVPLLVVIFPCKKQGLEAYFWRKTAQKVLLEVFFLSFSNILCYCLYCCRHLFNIFDILPYSEAIIYPTSFVCVLWRFLRRR